MLADAIAERKQGASVAISHQWAWPMVNGGAPHMDQAYSKSWFDLMGLVSLLESRRTAGATLPPTQSAISVQCDICRHIAQCAMRLRA